MRKILTFVMLVLGVSGTVYAQQSGLKIGYIDLQRVIRESQAGKAAKAAFEKEFKEKRDILEQKRQALERMKQEFLSKAAVMDEKARAEKAAEIERIEKELNRKRDDFRDELQKRDFELTQRILTELEGVIREFGNANGYALILERTEAGVLYGGEGVDVTDKIIEAYDNKKRGAKK
jgi:outer membrane protein